MDLLKAIKSKGAPGHPQEWRDPGKDKTMIINYLLISAGFVLGFFTAALCIAARKED
jgi:hypothetical protein